MAAKAAGGAAEYQAASAAGTAARRRRRRLKSRVASASAARAARRAASVRMLRAHSLPEDEIMAIESDLKKVLPAETQSHMYQLSVRRHRREKMAGEEEKMNALKKCEEENEEKGID